MGDERDGGAGAGSEGRETASHTAHCCVQFGVRPYTTAVIQRRGVGVSVGRRPE